MNRKETFERFRNLNEEKMKLEDELKTVKNEIADLSEKIKSMFEEGGESKVTMDSGETIFLQKKMFASLKKDLYTKEQAVTALEENGFADLVKKDFNSSQFSSVLREIQSRKEEIPPIIEKMFNVTPVFEVRIRKS